MQCLQSISDCLFVSEEDNFKTCERILTKFCGDSYIVTTRKARITIGITKTIGIWTGSWWILVDHDHQITLMRYAYALAILVRGRCRNEVCFLHIRAACCHEFTQFHPSSLRSGSVIHECVTVSSTLLQLGAPHNRRRARRAPFVVMSKYDRQSSNYRSPRLSPPS